MTKTPGTEQTINGQRLYITDTGKHIDADQWDKIFKPSHNLTMNKDKHYKGESPDLKHNYRRW